MKPAYQRLKRVWVREDAGTIALEEAQIAQLEQKYAVRLPEEFREYLLHACPKNDFCCDDNFTDWWALDRIKNIVDEYEHEISNPTTARLARTSLFFADYAIWCWAWAIVCAPGEDYGRILVIGGGAHDGFVADSFGEFVDSYMHDIDKLSPV